MIYWICLFLFFLHFRQHFPRHTPNKLKITATNISFFHIFFWCLLYCWWGPSFHGMLLSGIFFKFLWSWKSPFGLGGGDGKNGLGLNYSDPIIGWLGTNSKGLNSFDPGIGWFGVNVLGLYSYRPSIGWLNSSFPTIGWLEV